MNMRIRKIDFQGNAIWPDKTVPNVKCFLEIDLLSHGPIKGYFICDDATEKNLREDKSIFSYYFNLEPVFQRKYANSYRITKCRLQGHHGGEVRKFYFEANIFEDNADDPIPQAEEIKSVIFYFYINYHNIFYPPIWLEPHWNGNRYRKDSDGILKLYEEDGQKIEIDLNFDYIEHELESIKGSFEFIEQTLIVTINKPTNIEADIKRAIDLIEDFRTLLSFSSKKRINCYKYKYLVFGANQNGQDDKIVYHGECLNGQKRVLYKSDYRDTIFERFQDWHFFIQKSFPVYLSIKNKYNLYESIWMYISAIERETFESSFMSLCTALEAIKDSYLDNNRERFKLSANQQKKLRTLLNETINSFGNKNDIDSGIINNISDKIPDLYNPSFKSILLSLLSDLHLTTGDLEPDKLFDFIPIRNELFHKGKIDFKESQQIILEKERLRILFERILLRILNFSERPFRTIPDRPLPDDYFLKKNFIK